MQIHIKCLKCGRGTRNFEIGGVYYLTDRPSETFITERKIICPKCNNDISDEKCLIKVHDLMWRLLAANIGLIMKVEDITPIPKHLSKILPLQKNEYEIMRQRSKGNPKIVDKF